MQRGACIRPAHRGVLTLDELPEFRSPCPGNDALLALTRYQKRIFGPMLDQIDIYIEVPCVDYEKLSSERRGEASEQIRARGEGFTFQV